MMTADKYFLGCKVNRKNGLLLLVGILVVCLAAIAKYNGRYEMRWNISESLKAWFFIVDTKTLPQKGDYVAFNYYDKSNQVYKMGLSEAPQVVFIKQVVGVEGDVVTHQDREIFVNGQSMGIAKPRSKGGRKLDINPFTGAIPKGYYYVYTPHKDSYDSRYADIGLVPVKEVRGKANDF